MAADIVGPLDRLGLEKAHVLDQDRSGRVACRFPLDRPNRLSRLGILEFVPTGDCWEAISAELTMKAYY
jgi:haloacetate dehalogenase